MYQIKLIFIPKSISLSDKDLMCKNIYIEFLTEIDFDFLQNFY